MRSQSLLLFPVCLAAIACSDVKSSAVTTAGMYLDYTVVTEGVGTGSEVQTMLRVGGSTSTTYVDLEAGDQLSVVVGEENSVLNHSSLGVLHSYNQSFETDSDESEFILSFDRADQAGAPSSSAILPVSFEITLPLEGTEFSRSNDTGEMVVTWADMEDDLVNVIVEGDCFASYNALEQSDMGSHTIPLSYFLDNAYDTSSACSAEVRVERMRVGKVDPAFGGGRATGVQRRIVQVRMNP